MTIGALQHTAVQATTGATPQGSAAPLQLGTFPKEALDIHPALQEVRRLAEFQPAPPSPLDEWLKHPIIKKWLDGIGHGLEQILKDLGKLLGQAQPQWMPDLPQNIRDIFSGFIGFILVLAGLYALYLLLTVLMRWQERKNQKKPTAARFFEETLLINSEYHYQKACQASQNADYRTGVQELYMASLCLLDEKAIVPYESARTNLEYQYHLTQQARTDLKPEFQALARTFEAIRYGNQTAGPEQFQNSHQSFQAFQMGVAVPNG